MPSKTTTPSAVASIAPTPPKSPLPSPQTFDILPRLHFLLSRLLSPQSTSYKDLPPLPLKDLETQASEIKILIQKAKAAVEQLPDVERGAEEQEMEIKELEEKARSLRNVLKEVGARAGEGRAEA
jgi:hypothetical protein